MNWRVWLKAEEPVLRRDTGEDTSGQEEKWLGSRTLAGAWLVLVQGGKEIEVAKRDQLIYAQGSVSHGDFHRCR